MGKLIQKRVMSGKCQETAKSTKNCYENTQWTLNREHLPG